MAGTETAAAEMLRAARQGRTPPLADLPAALQPADAAGAYAIQRAAIAGTDIGGWKVGRTGPGKPCLCAPLPALGIAASPARLPQGRLRGIEAEVAFRIGHDLPPRATPYSRAEIIAALATAHPAIEVLESAYVDPDAVAPFTNLADSMAHGGFVFGPGRADWQELDFPNTTVTQTIDGATLARTGNPAGDMVSLVEWLANEGSHWAGGLRAGQFVTCGSWTGKTWAPAGAEARVSFPALGEASVRFAA